MVVTATFTVTAVLVGTGAVIDEQEIVVAPENTPQLLLNIEGYECSRVNYSVRVQGYAESVSVVEQVPACNENGFCLLGVACDDNVMRCRSHYIHSKCQHCSFP